MLGEKFYNFIILLRGLTRDRSYKSIWRAILCIAEFKYHPNVLEDAHEIHNALEDVHILPNALEDVYILPNALEDV